MIDSQIEERGFFFPTEEPECPNVTLDFPTITQSATEENNAPYTSPDEPGHLLQPNYLMGPRNMILVFAGRVTEAISSTQSPPEKRTFPTNPLFLQKIDHFSTVDGNLCIVRHGREIGTTELEVFEDTIYSPWNEGKNKPSSTNGAPYNVPWTGGYTPTNLEEAA